MNTPFVLRKTVAVLLVLSWVILSGFDLLEDLRLPIHFGLHSPKEATLPGVGKAVKLVNDNLERGSRTLTSQLGLFKLPAVQSTALQLLLNTSTVFKKAFRLHKLYRIFLI